MSLFVFVIVFFALFLIYFAKSDGSFASIRPYTHLSRLFFLNNNELYLLTIFQRVFRHMAFIS